MVNYSQKKGAALRFAIVGCGRVGKALGRNLIENGYVLTGISCKTESSVREAGKYFGIENVSTTPAHITRCTDVVFITTPDGVISDVCDEIAAGQGLDPQTTVLHCSGAHPSTILSAAKSCDAVIGSMHPLQSFAGDTDKNPFKGIIIAIEGEKKAVEIATEMARVLDSVCLTIKTDAKTLYHAAAVVASNYLVAIQHMAFDLLQKAGISGNDAFKVLGPLIKGTLGNIEQVGTVKALTGPIARGDVETITRHIKGIRENATELLQLYEVLGQYTVEIAALGKTVSQEKAVEMKRILTKQV